MVLPDVSASPVLLRATFGLDEREQDSKHNAAHQRAHVPGVKACPMAMAGLMMPLLVTSLLFTDRLIRAAHVDHRLADLFGRDAGRRLGRGASDRACRILRSVCRGNRRRKSRRG